MIDGQIINNFIVKKKTTISKAIKIIKNNNEKFKISQSVLLIVDKKKFTGILTEGDIRRYLITHKYKKNTYITTLINKNPIFFYQNISKKEIIAKIPQELKIRKRKSKNFIEHIPILNEKKMPVQILNFNDLNEDHILNFVKLNNNEININIYGLGYVGLTFALHLSKNGFIVHGYDYSKKKINLLKNKKIYFFERGLVSLFQKHINKNFLVSNKINTKSNIHIIAVGTKINDKLKKLEQKNIVDCVKKISKFIKKKSLVMIRSTVPVGYTNNTIVKILRKETGFIPGKDFYVANTPERTLAGDAINELNNLPQIVGGINSTSIDLASEIFKKINTNVVRVENSEIAELIKLANNSVRDLNFNFSNELARICSKYNVDVYQAINAANLGYPRNKIALPSPGVGGSCLSKDPYLLSTSSENKNIFVTSRKLNDDLINFQIKRIEKYINKYKNKPSINILICGLAFKGNPETSDIRNSVALEIGKKLKKRFKKIYVYDPVVSDDVIRKIGFIPQKISSGFKNKDAVLILNDHVSFNKIDVTTMINKMNKNPIIFDGWNIFDKKQLERSNNIYINLSKIDKNVS